MIGVDYDLFWTLNPKSLSPFIKAFRLRQEYDDYQAWNNGAYIRMAIASTLNKDAKYPTKPNSSKKKDESESDEMSQEEIKDRFMRQMNTLNSRFGKEE